MFRYLCMLGYLGFVAAAKLDNGGKHWAVIVAGSNGYGNYRHQADVCHAYHVLKDHGIEEENIIVMMYDDIAHNEENPDKGVIINRPNGENVYEGVKIDYKGKDVTPEVFLAVIQGHKSAVSGVGTGRVLESGSNDNVFINFVDHGAPGLVAFPSAELHARKLMEALKYMHSNQMYHEMVIYLEACESGSMFQKLLPDNLNIYATTAANAKESSYAIYFDKKLDTYLGDVYSVKWMENADVDNLNKETLMAQFKEVKKETNTSHVMEYGDMSLSKQPAGDFLGNTPSARNIYYPHLPDDAVPSPDVDLHILSHKIAVATSEEDRVAHQERLVQLIHERDEITQEMKHIVSFALNHQHLSVSEAMANRSEIINFDCYEPAVVFYSENCRQLSQTPFALRVLYALQNVCNVEDIKLEAIINAMEKVC
ncbi:legumain-like [Watersipora subatra]|uniref:legumain-like n=1 Tax=Watersipora subatra TaxID=2589382 RepID=UPI00355C2738